MWKNLAKESNEITALVVLCQDYVLFDEEFSSDKRIQRRLDDADFWIDIAQKCNSKVKSYLYSQTEQEDADGFDNEEIFVPYTSIMEFIMSPSNRLDINDMICETIEEHLNFLSKK